MFVPFIMAVDNIATMSVFQFLNIQFFPVRTVNLYSTGKTRIKAAYGTHHIYAINLAV